MREKEAIEMQTVIIHESWHHEGLSSYDSERQVGFSPSLSCEEWVLKDPSLDIKITDL